MLKELRESAPRSIGPYRPVAHLGSGGMGEVYLAVDQRVSGRPPVAVKRVRRELATDDEFRVRFRREVAAARAVRSNRVAALIDADPDGDPPWLATQYIPGPSLHEAITHHGPLPPHTLRHLATHLAHALTDVHHAGLIHRDIKPGNILLTTHTPHLIDFGIARALDATALTGTGHMIGSPGYMSPEHIAGGGRVRPASDVFSLGAVLCFAATGRGPFGDGAVAAVLYRISTHEVDLSDVPTELADPISACLAADPDQRPTAPELAALLGAPLPDAGAGAVALPVSVRQRIAAQEEQARAFVTAPPPVPLAPPVAGPPPTAVLTTMGPPAAVTDLATVTAPRPGEQPRRRRRAVIGAGLLAATALAVAGALQMWSGAGGSGEQGAAGGSGADSGADTGGSGDPAALPEPERVAVDEHGGADRSRSFTTRAGELPDGWAEWSGGFGAEVRDCALGSTLLVCRLDDGTLEALSAADGSALWRSEPGGSASAEATGPPLVSGSLVLAAEGDALVARSTADGTPQWTSPLPGQEAEAEAGGHLAAGDGLVFVGATGTGGTTVGAYALADGTQAWTLEAGEPHTDGDGHPVPAVQAHGGGQLFVNGAGGLLALDAGSGEERAADPSGAAYCADARLLSGYVTCRYPAGDDHAGGFYRLAANADLAPVLGEGDLERDSVFTLPADGADGADGAEGTTGTEGSGEARETVHAFTTERMLTVREGEGGPEVRVRPVGGAEDSGPELFQTWGNEGAPVSPPVFVDERAVFAAGDTLYVFGDGPGPAPDVELPGSGEGAPRLLAAGGAVHLVWDDGTAVSVELP